MKLRGTGRSAVHSHLEEPHSAQRQWQVKLRSTGRSAVHSHLEEPQQGGSGAALRALAQSSGLAGLCPKSHSICELRNPT